MDNVISIKSRKKLGAQDFKANDAKAATEGRYIGCLPKADAEVLRSWQKSLLVQQSQINELIAEFDGDYKAYLRSVATVLLYLQFPPEAFDPEKEKLFIGEDGHAWVVKKELKESEESGEEQ